MRRGNIVFLVEDVVGSAPAQVGGYGLFFQKFCKIFFYFRQLIKFSQHFVFIGAFRQTGGVEVGLGIIHAQHKGRTIMLHQDGAHHQGTSAVITLMEELWPAHLQNVGTGRFFPGRVFSVLFCPGTQVADGKLALLVKTVCIADDMLFKVFSFFYIRATQYDVVQLKEMVQALRTKQFDVLFQQVVHILVACQHVVEDFVTHGLSMHIQSFVDGLKVALHREEVVLHLIQIDYIFTGHGLRAGAQ